MMELSEVEGSNYLNIWIEYNAKVAVKHFYAMNFMMCFVLNSLLYFPS